MRRLLLVLVLLLPACSNGETDEAQRVGGSFEFHNTIATTTTAPPTTLRPIVRVVTTRPSRHRVRSRCARQRTLDEIARDESGGNYAAQNPKSSASGKYQVLDSTWDGYAGYESAKDAPPEVQERWAREAYAKSGSRPWRESGC